MAENENETPESPSVPLPVTSSVSERGFAPAGDAEQGISVQFTTQGLIVPCESGDVGGDEDSTK